MTKEEKYTEELPYEKFAKRGPESLTDAELLAIVIRSGSKDASALQIARDILKLRDEKNGLASLYHISVKELKEIRGRMTGTWRRDVGGSRKVGWWGKEV